MIAHPVNDGEEMTPTTESMKVAREISKELADYGVNMTVLFLMEPKICQALDLAVRKERESCAEVVKKSYTVATTSKHTGPFQPPDEHFSPHYMQKVSYSLEEIAERIRQRGEGVEK